MNIKKINMFTRLQKLFIFCWLTAWHFILPVLQHDITLYMFLVWI